MWPRFRRQDCVLVRASGRVGYVNSIQPNERGDDWLFEVSFGARDLEDHGADELELVEPSGQEHDPEIEVRLRTSDENASIAARKVGCVAADAFSVETESHSFEGDRLSVEFNPREHPREATRAFLERLGSAWLVEHDGWYANVDWVNEPFPIAGVEAVRLFLRPWRDPSSGERLPGEPNE